MKFSEIQNRATIDGLRFINIPLSIASNSGDSSYTYKPGNDDMLVHDIRVEMIDSTGKVVNNELASTLRTQLMLEITTNDSTSFHITPFPVMAMNDFKGNMLWRGWYLDHDLQYTFKLTAQGSPAVGDYPLSVNITLVAYKLDKI